jgi:hypothetical protein
MTTVTESATRVSQVKSWLVCLYDTDTVQQDRTSVEVNHPERVSRLDGVLFLSAKRGRCVLL